MSSQWDHNPDYFQFRRRLDPPWKPRGGWSWIDRLDAFWIGVLIGTLLLVPILDRMGF